MANVTGSISTQTSFTQVPTTVPGSVTPLNNAQSLKVTFQTSGTAADTVDLKYSATLTFTASTAQTLDLTALTDIYGGTVNLARVRSLTIYMKSTTDGATLTVGAAGTNPWAAILGTTGTLVMQSSTSTNASMLVLTAPNTTGWVTSGSSKNLKLTPSAHAFSVDIEITGCSA